MAAIGRSAVFCSVSQAGLDLRRRQTLRAEPKTMWVKRGADTCHGRAWSVRKTQLPSQLLFFLIFPRINISEHLIKNFRYKYFQTANRLLWVCLVLPLPATNLLPCAALQCVFTQYISISFERTTSKASGITKPSSSTQLLTRPQESASHHSKPPRSNKSRRFVGASCKRLWWGH